LKSKSWSTKASPVTKDVLPAVQLTRYFLPEGSAWVARWLHVTRCAGNLRFPCEPAHRASGCASQPFEPFSYINSY
jgi:hypothetical protein